MNTRIAKYTADIAIVKPAPRTKESDNLWRKLGRMLSWDSFFESKDWPYMWTKK